MRVLATIFSGMFVVGLVTSDARAQNYPSRTVTLVSPYPSGGFVDGLARVIAKQFNSLTGGTMIVESRPGRDGIVGTYSAARAEPDGYTLLLGDSNPLSVAPLLHATLPYDSINDFTRIAIITNSNPILVTRVESPLKTLADLIATAKASPGKLTFASGTVGQQIMGEMLKIRAGISLLHVPYKGGNSAMIDTLGGHVDLATTATANYIGLRGKLRPFGIASATRFKNLSEVPTMIEQGYTDFVTGAWLGILGPKGMSPALVSYLTPLVAEIVKTDDFVNFAERAGNQIEFFGAEEFSRRMIVDRETLAPLIKAAGMKQSE